MYAYILHQFEAFLYNNTNTTTQRPHIFGGSDGRHHHRTWEILSLLLFAYLHSLGIFTTHQSMRHDVILGILLYSRACTLQDLSLTQIFLKNHTTHNATQCKYQMFDIRY